MRAIVLTMIMLSSLAETHSRSHIFCEVSTFSLAPAQMQIEVQNFGVTIGNDGAHAHLVLVNRTTNPIVRMLILAELVDVNGQHLLTLPFYAATRNELLPGMPVFPIPSRTDMGPEALRPGESRALAADINQATAECPAKVRAALIDAKFLDDTEFHYSTGEWQVEPSVASAKALQLNSFPRPLPFQDLIEVALDEHGRMISADNHYPDPRIVQWFERALSSWSFAPRIKNGKPTASYVKLLFRIHDVYDQRDPTLFDDSAFESGSVIAVDVFPKGDIGHNEQFILAGDLPVVVPRW